MRVKMRSSGPSTAAVGRHEAAEVGEQGDQRGLPHVGRFAAHVGAGDQQHAAAVGEQAVVGDEGFGLLASSPSTTGWRPPVTVNRGFGRQNSGWH